MGQPAHGQPAEHARCCTRSRPGPLTHHFDSQPTLRLVATAQCAARAAHRPEHCTLCLERPQGTAARRPPRRDGNARRRGRGRLRRRRSGRSAARAWTRAGRARGSGPRRWGPHPASGARGASAATAWARAGRHRGRRPTRAPPRPARGRPARCLGGALGQLGSTWLGGALRAAGLPPRIVRAAQQATIQYLKSFYVQALCKFKAVCA